jgi:hypothetical protein
LCSPKIKSDGTFGNYVGVQEQKNEFRVSKFDILNLLYYYIGVQEQKKILKILKFDILRVRPILIPTKDSNLCFVKKFSVLVYLTDRILTDKNFDRQEF